MPEINGNYVTRAEQDMYDKAMERPEIAENALRLQSQDDDIYYQGLDNLRDMFMFDNDEDAAHILFLHRRQISNEQD